MAMELIGVIALKSKHYVNFKKSIIKHLPKSPRYFINRLIPSSKFMKIVSCLFLMIFAFATLNSIMRSSSFEFEKISYKETQQKDLLTESIDKQQVSYDSVNIEQLLGVLFHDLTNEGLKKPTQSNAIFLTNDNNADPGIGPSIVSEYNMELVLLSDLEKQKNVIDNSVDFVFTTDFPAASKFIDRTLKVDGVVAFITGENPSAKHYKPSNYKTVYVRRLDLIAVAMIKKEEFVRHDQPPPVVAAPRKLLGYSSDAKKAALQNLEDVLLEPPRASSRISRKYLKRTKYLPNLMGDSLESYPRRVFIDVGLAEKEGERKNDWFHKNYPTRNKNFEMYNINIEIITAEEASAKEMPQIGMSDWMRTNIKDEEFVVMKAEAEVVEEMIKRDTIGLVDELFLECKPHKKRENNRSRRAYWECLALYGNLRDKGVAVHQWWG
ncbi:uncharacterized protein LOC107634174 isoform X1 [Arachis ipaensis]|uniref:DUF7870 domain-containing protein n=1 Tax=Arachis hypogaea TaxID=3818 RepID=A0A445A7L4_ARAHY|nr:uncharacterized protein LOC107634174 isoform X1 [Arachis ipaensis]RYR22437.1 hypothetical protein Ahy_B03g067720 isoform A [Arachis hypogaea]